MKRLPIVPALVLVTAVAAGCGGGSSNTSAAGTSQPSAASTASPSAAATAPSGSASSPSAAAAAMISIDNFKYAVPGSVAPGSKVTVVNHDTIAHTVTADSGNAFDVPVPGGSSMTFTAPKEAGSYAFHCTYHSNMHGKLTVG